LIAPDFCTPVIVIMEVGLDLNANIESAFTDDTGCPWVGVPLEYALAGAIAKATTLVITCASLSPAEALKELTAKRIKVLRDFGNFAKVEPGTDRAMGVRAGVGANATVYYDKPLAIEVIALARSGGKISKAGSTSTGSLQIQTREQAALDIKWEDEATELMEAAPRGMWRDDNLRSSQSSRFSDAPWRNKKVEPTKQQRHRANRNASGAPARRNEARNARTAERILIKCADEEADDEHDSHLLMLIVVRNIKFRPCICVNGVPTPHAVVPEPATERSFYTSLAPFRNKQAFRLSRPKTQVTSSSSFAQALVWFEAPKPRGKAVKLSALLNQLEKQTRDVILHRSTDAVQDFINCKSQEKGSIVGNAEMPQRLKRLSKTIVIEPDVEDEVPDTAKEECAPPTV